MHIMFKWLQIATYYIMFDIVLNGIGLIKDRNLLHHVSKWSCNTKGKIFSQHQYDPGVLLTKCHVPIIIYIICFNGFKWCFFLLKDHVLRYV